jgi:hypothetical protein
MVASIATIGAVMISNDPAGHAPAMRAASSSSTTTTWPPPTTTTTWPPPTTTTTTFAWPTTTTTTTDPTVFAAWSRVAVCENAGWNPPRGPAYPDSLGISRANWVAYGGGADLSPAVQIAVGQRIEAAAGLAGFVPDQEGCAAW